MFFNNSKIFELLLEPLLFPFILILLATFAWLRKKQSLVRLFIVIAIILPSTYCFTVFSTLPLQILENHVARGDFSDRQIDGIIVLGDFTGDGYISKSRGNYSLSENAELFTATLELKNLFPDAPVLFGGLSGTHEEENWNGIDQTKDLIRRIGGLGKIVFFEENGNDLYEVALNCKKISAARAGNNWILISLASRMPRAVLNFKAAGWTGIIPYPVGYHTPLKGARRFWSTDGIDRLREVLQEYSKLLFDYLHKKSTSFLPD